MDPVGDLDEIDVAELAHRRSAGAPVLDVRNPDEYDEAHIPGATLIPLPEIPDRVAELPRDEELLVVCRSGARSGRAAEFLRAQGVAARNVTGGMLAWIEAGETVATGMEPG